MSEITLERINKENWRTVTALKVADHQTEWVAPNWYSIIQALFEGYDSHALKVGEVYVGYVMYEIVPDKHAMYIDRVMIAADEQRKGYGTQAMTRLLELARQHPDVNAAYISFLPDNDVARQVYARAGFRDTGEIVDGEIVYKIDLNAPQDSK
jgi:diamine N-acetyltransferase